MKVIIQDGTTKRFFSADGQWVASDAEAKDFVSLMRAYHFAKQFAGYFEILLYCPDDGYHASIIGCVGAGKGKRGEAGLCVGDKTAKVDNAKCKKSSGPGLWARFNACMTSTRNYLN